ncbi:MAG: ABC transporter ATP-binding protein [Pseudomonadota bacterium]
MLRFEQLGKTYGSHSVFENLSHRFSCGTFALQGPNGIGKSTLLALLAGAQTPDTGEIWIDGHLLGGEAIAAKRRLSYVPDECPIYPFISGKDFLRFVAAAKKTKPGKETDDLVAGLGLFPYLDTRFDAMSLGTQKKFMLCAAWIGDPAVMLIDEPTNGLDAASKELLVRLFEDRQNRSVVLFSTHDAEFVETVNATVVQLDLLIGKP